MPPDKKMLFTGLFTFVLIHMVAEGYILSGGSFLCIVSWLIIGCAYDYRFDNNLANA